MLEVLDTVKKVHGAEFPVTFAGRRAGDPAMIVANPALARQELGWEPEFDDLERIVRSALDWEDRLSRRNAVD